MKKIEIGILNVEAVPAIGKSMAAAARLTQHGHKVQNFADFMELYNKPFSDTLISNMCHLPHPTLQKFSVINIAIVGASRKFLAQITRHQNEVKFMSASTQYSDYSDSAAFAIPYELLFEYGIQEQYLKQCRSAVETYKQLVSIGIDKDTAGYMLPQSLRNVLIISATPYQWKHMIAQRICRRNTAETRIVMLKIWDLLYKLEPVIFAPDTTGPFCMTGYCKEGKMSCGKPISSSATPEQILKEDYPLLFKEEDDEDKGY